MADDFQSFSRDAVQNAERVRDAVSVIQAQMKEMNDATKAFGDTYTNLATDTKKVGDQAKDYAKTQQAVLASSKGILKARQEITKAEVNYGKLQARQARLAKDRNAAADKLAEHHKAIAQAQVMITTGTAKEAKEAKGVLRLRSRQAAAQEETVQGLDRQLEILNDATEQAGLLVDDFKLLGQEAASLNEKTNVFSSIGDAMEKISSVVPGLSAVGKFAEPFSAAANQARQLTVAKAEQAALEEKIASLNEDYSVENLQKAGLSDITQGTEGKEAKNLLSERKKGNAELIKGLKPLKNLVKGFGAIAARMIALKVVIEIFKTLGQAFFGMDEKSVNIAKSMGTTKEAAEGTVAAMTKAAADSGKLYTSIEKATKALIDFQNVNKTNVALSADILHNQLLLTERLGISTEVAAHLSEKFIAYGESAEGSTKAIFDMNENLRVSGKSITRFQDVMSDVAETSGYARMQFGGSTEALAKAAINARRLGLSMQQQQSMADGLLNFEESMSAQFDLQLLTGKEINLDKARELALMGKSSQAAAELLKQTKGIPKSLLKSPVIMDSFAKLLNISRDEVADMLFEQKSFNKQLGITRENIKQVQTASEEMMRKMSHGYDSYYSTLEDKEKKYLDELLLTTDRSLSMEERKKQALDKYHNDRMDKLRKELGLNKGQFDQIQNNVTATQAFEEAMQKLRDQLVKLNKSNALGNLTDIIIDFVERASQVGLGRALLGGGTGTLELKERAAKNQTSVNEKMDLYGLDATTADFSDKKGEDYRKLTKIINQSANYGKLDEKTIVYLAKVFGEEVVTDIINNSDATRRSRSKSTIDGDEKINAREFIGDESFKAMLNTASAESTDDFIIRPGQPVQKFNKGDLVMGGTQLDKSSGKTEALLERLVAAVERGGDVYIDGNKVGNAMVLASSKLS